MIIVIIITNIISNNRKCFCIDLPSWCSNFALSSYSQHVRFSGSLTELDLRMENTFTTSWSVSHPHPGHALWRSLPKSGPSNPLIHESNVVLLILLPVAVPETQSKPDLGFHMSRSINLANVVPKSLVWILLSLAHLSSPLFSPEHWTSRYPSCSTKPGSTGGSGGIWQMRSRSSTLWRSVQAVPRSALCKTEGLKNSSVCKTQKSTTHFSLLPHSGTWEPQVLSTVVSGVAVASACSYLTSYCPKGICWRRNGSDQSQRQMGKLLFLNILALSEVVILPKHLGQFSLGEQVEICPSKPIQILGYDIQDLKTSMEFGWLQGQKLIDPIDIERKGT